MKKNRIKDQERKRRLRLSRETIRLLHAPALLELARGGEESGYTCSCGSCRCAVSEVNHNCYPITCSGTTTGTTTDTDRV